MNATEPLSLPSPESSLLLVSGIANPASLKQYALKISKKITELHFPDHHAFTANDISEITAVFENIAADEKYILTTEKDAARFQKYSDLPQKYLNRMFYLPISIDFLHGEAENFEKKRLLLFLVPD